MNLEMAFLSILVLTIISLFCYMGVQLVLIQKSLMAYSKLVQDLEKLNTKKSQMSFNFQDESNHSKDQP